MQGDAKHLSIPGSSGCEPLEGEAAHAKSPSSLGCIRQLFHFVSHPPRSTHGDFFPFSGIAVNPALEKNWAFLPRPANTSSVSRLARQAANLISYTQSKLTMWFSAGALGRSRLCARPRDKCFLSASGVCMGSQGAETSGRCRALLPVSLAPAAVGTGVGFGIPSQDGSQDIPALARVLTWLRLPKRERNPNFLW